MKKERKLTKEQIEYRKINPFSLFYLGDDENSNVEGTKRSQQVTDELKVLIETFKKGFYKLLATDNGGDYIHTGLSDTGSLDEIHRVLNNLVLYHFDPDVDIYQE